MQDEPYGYCRCGCGEKTEIAPRTRSELGWVKGKPKSFRPKHALRLAGLAHRLDDAIDKDGPGGCWLWTRAIAASGYGVVRVNGETRLAHRVVYEQERGPIPEGLTLDHVHARGCRHRHCVNPAHLEPVPDAMNIRRSVEVRRATDIARVREMQATGAPLRRISRELGIGRHFVQNVARGKYA